MPSETAAAAMTDAAAFAERKVAEIEAAGLSLWDYTAAAGSDPDWRAVRAEDRPKGFVEMRRALCSSPHLCFEFGNTAPICGPCDWAACKACKEGSLSV